LRLPPRAASLTAQAVAKYFEELAVPDFANAGFVPQESVTLPMGATAHPTSMLEQLRKLGMLVEVQDSKLWLRKECALCVAGEPLSPEQAKLLVSASRVSFHVYLTVESMVHILYTSCSNTQCRHFEVAIGREAVAAQGVRSVRGEQAKLLVSVFCCHGLTLAFTRS
jgi:Insertion domain in 60S ribosomal protein L10P